MGGVPDGQAISHDEHLRRLVTHTCGELYRAAQCMVFGDVDHVDVYGKSIQLVPGPVVDGTESGRPG